MTIYVFRDGRWRDKRSGAPMPIPARDGLCAPRVQSDIAEYRSPVDGRPITSRSGRREDLTRNDCVEVDPPARRRGFKNPAFAGKRGLPLSE
jgi:hypothetical protein